jgi:hypothetical protein
MHRVVAMTSFVVALGFISAASVGGYLLYQQMSEALSAPIGQIAAVVSDVAAGIREPFETAPAPGAAPAAPIPVATVAIPVGPKADVPRDEIVPASVTVPADSEPAPPPGPPLEIAPPDANAYRERGIFAYRSGDLDRAIADFDRAIQLDPKFAAAYIDRSIVLYRLRRFEQAFADIAHAKRIERTKPKGGKKGRSPDPAIEMSVTPLPRARRTARFDSPREVGFLAGRRSEMPY